MPRPLRRRISRLSVGNRRYLRGFWRFGLTVGHGTDGGGMRTGMVFRRLKNAAPNGAEAV
ncbi:hypothetical protein [uncultured Neisseria sp.]|uniref:hypothetical protein n=1 Tax=uncultured Neisseria sp. TaxID=237778 RepID=UPI00261E86C1|nr:hypothetical protein [uncultured Neisseria sp.]